MHVLRKLKQHKLIQNMVNVKTMHWQPKVISVKRVKNESQKHSRRPILHVWLLCTTTALKNSRRYRKWKLKKKKKKNRKDEKTKRAPYVCECLVMEWKPRLSEPQTIKYDALFFFFARRHKCMVLSHIWHLHVWRGKEKRDFRISGSIRPVMEELIL